MKPKLTLVKSGKADNSLGVTFANLVRLLDDIQNRLELSMLQINQRYTPSPVVQDKYALVQVQLTELRAAVLDHAWASDALKWNEG